MPRDTGSYGYDLPTPVRDEETPWLPPNSVKFLDSRENGGVLREVVDNISPYSDAFSMENSSCQLVYDVPFEYRSSALSRYLGYAYVDGGRLKRVLPMAHPYFEFMRCRRIMNVHGMKWLGLQPREPEDLGEDFPRPPYAEYDQLRMTLGFEPVPFACKTDAEVASNAEYERFTYVRAEAGFESLYIEGGSSDSSFLFDTAPLGVDGKPAFAAGKNTFIAKPTILLTWYDVPLEWIQKGGEPGYYGNIFSGLSKVNNAKFLGFPKNTLLMHTPKIEIRPNPLPPDISTTPQFLANVTFAFKYFEPSPLGTGVSENPGHNAAIFRGGPGIVDSRKWFPCSLGGDGTTRVYKSYDYRLLFQKP